MQQKIFEKRFGKIPFDKELLHKTLQHGYIGLDGGNVSTTSRHFSGRNAFIFRLNNVRVYDMIAIWGDNVNQDSKSKAENKKLTEEIFGADVINEFETKMPEAFKIVKNSMAKTLFDEAYGETNKGKGKLKPTSRMTLESMEKHILDYKKSKEYSDYLKTKPNPNQCTLIADKLISSMKERQKGNVGKIPIISSSKSGPENYSKFDNELFDFLTAKLDKGLSISLALGSHAYTLVGYKLENNKKKLVLRNPWGKLDRDIEDFKHKSLENRKSTSVFRDKTELGGLLEIEINEFTAHGYDFDFEEETKVVNLEDMKNTISKQLFSAYISEQPIEKQAKLKRGMELPNSLQNIKNSDFVQKLADEYMANDAIKFHVEKMGHVPENVFYRDIKRLTGSEYLTKTPPDKAKSKENTLVENIYGKLEKDNSSKLIRSDDIDKIENEAAKEIKGMGL